jgi:hypothetical protein
MRKLSINKEMALRVVAHHIFAKTPDRYVPDTNGVDMNAMITQFGHVLDQVLDHEILWTFDEGASEDAIRQEDRAAIFNSLDVEYRYEDGVAYRDAWTAYTLSVSEHGRHWLVTEGLVPSEFVHYLIGDPLDAAFSPEELSAEAKAWFANAWQDPTGWRPDDAATRGAAGIKKTTRWVTQLAYTLAEAKRAYAVIAQSDLPARGKAAEKAHVTRRIVQS